jgi:hypothetical protein
MTKIIRYLFLAALSFLSMFAHAIDGCIVNQSSAISNTIRVEDLLGTYRRFPVQNNYHVGTISRKSSTSNSLVWTNQANVSWTLTPDLTNNRLVTSSDNPYQSSPSGKNFSLQFQSGALLGFIFNGELYALDGAISDSFDTTTGQLTVNSVSVDSIDYCNAVVTIDKVISVGVAPAIGTKDTFDSSTGRLTIPSVNVSGTKYYNVVVTVGTVLSAGKLPSFNSTTSLHGYASIAIQESPVDYRYGFSTYTSIQKVSEYQINNLQFGWGTWLMPDNRSTSFSLCPEGTVMQKEAPTRFWDVFQTVEGGPGQWRSTFIPSNISKFRPNSTPDCYNDELTTPGYDFSGKTLSSKVLGMAQLSNQLLLAPDGLTFNLGSQPSALLGYGYIALPLIPANGLSGTQAVGNQSWTLFLNTNNFKGPVAFYTPKIFTLIDSLDARIAGKGMDAMPAITPSLALEINGVPAYTSTDSSGVTYRRIAKMNFPVTDSPTQATLTQDFKHYSKAAFWNNFSNTTSLRSLPEQFDPKGIYNVQLIPQGLRATMSDTNENVAIDSWVTTSIGQNKFNGTVFSLAWSDPKTAGYLPEYFRKDGKVWTPVLANQVPASTNLISQNFPALTASAWPSLDTSKNSAWSSTNWAAGPFSTKLNDGSTVTYVWYKFISQPAIAQLGLDTSTLQNLQNTVEKMHAQYGLNGPTLAPPSSGNMVSLDSALLVTPPSNLSVGYVPIAIGQE